MFHQKIKTLFQSAVCQVSSNISQFTIHPEKDLIRNKKLPPDKLISFLVSEGSSSTKNELLDFFDMDVAAPTASAFNQQRSKLKPDALEAVFKHFNLSVNSIEETSAYRFLVADGSTFTFFSKPSFTSSEHYVSEGHSAKGFYSMHLNAFYDLDRHTYTDALIQPVHDEDGRKWVTSLEWETRDGYHKPGEICIVEYDKAAKHIVGIPKRIWSGGTKRGCIEGPHMYKRNGCYYLMCAEGGTGYGHFVTIGRLKNILVPYESDPCNPILTSTPDFDEMDNDDAVKLNRYNPDSYLQKSGHGSIVETSLSEVYMVHCCGRPLQPKLRCTIGRETCIQKCIGQRMGGYA